MFSHDVDTMTVVRQIARIMCDRRGPLSPHLGKYASVYERLSNAAIANP